MQPEVVESLLAEALSDPLPREELEDLQARARLVAEQAQTIRGLPLEAEDPSPFFTLEWEA